MYLWDDALGADNDTTSIFTVMPTCDGQTNSNEHAAEDGRIERGSAGSEAPGNSTIPRRI